MNLSGARSCERLVGKSGKNLRSVWGAANQLDCVSKRSTAEDLFTLARPAPRQPTQFKDGRLLFLSIAQNCPAIVFAHLPRRSLRGRVQLRRLASGHTHARRRAASRLGAGFKANRLSLRPQRQHTCIPRRPHGSGRGAVHLGGPQRREPARLERPAFYGGDWSAGKFVGEPTAGWIIYTGSTTLLDGSTVRTPGTRITGADGKVMELNPMPVDIPVKRPVGETLTDRDTHLDKAVKELLAQIQKEQQQKR